MPGTGGEWSLGGQSVPERSQCARMVAKTDYMHIDFAQRVYLSVQGRPGRLSCSCTKRKEWR
jgi:hypothetical protein